MNHVHPTTAEGITPAYLTGLVEEVLYQVGDQVADGAPLLAFKPAA